MTALTGAQIRAARALLRWSAKELAREAAVGVATVSRAEVEDGTTSLTSANLNAIRQALENAGIDFIAENGGGVGVRFRQSLNPGAT
nr:transcriptional regulator [Ensifer sp. ZNC0028]